MIGKKQLRYILSVVLAVILLGCSAGFRPAGDEIRDQSCGKVYTQEEAQELILENLKWMFKNYESAKIEFTDIKKAFIDYEIGNRVIFGYSINAVINTKSIDGVYSGDRTHLFFLKDNKVFYNYTKPDTKLKKAYWIEVKPDISE